MVWEFCTFWSGEIKQFENYMLQAHKSPQTLLQIQQHLKVLGWNFHESDFGTMLDFSLRNKFNIISLCH